MLRAAELREKVKAIDILTLSNAHPPGAPRVVEHVAAGATAKRRSECGLGVDAKVRRDLSRWEGPPRLEAVLTPANSSVAWLAPGEAN
jgi:hypothetical protein